MYGEDEVRLADPDSFRFYLGSFAKDLMRCYCVGKQLRGGNGASFRALNYCYATDGRWVWTLGGLVKDADTQSFQVCDDGVYSLGGEARAPYGYGKDRSRVYYYDFDGAPRLGAQGDPGYLSVLERWSFCAGSSICILRRFAVAWCETRYVAEVGAFLQQGPPTDLLS